MSSLERRVAGKRLTRIDGIGKVTGKHVYAADFALPGMLFGKILRSSEAHARIARLDVAKALALPGVRSVLSAAATSRRSASARRSRTAPCSPKARSVSAARRSRPWPRPAWRSPRRPCAAIEIEYEPLPAVFDPEEALLPGAPLVHAGWSDYQALPVFDREGNISGRSAIGGGDVEAGFAQSYRVYEHRFTTQHVHPGYTEPRAAVASWDGNGDVIVWTNTQLPFDMKNMLAEVLDLAGQQGARDRARHRRRLRRQAARRRRALRGVAGAQVAPARSR